MQDYSLVHLIRYYLIIFTNIQFFRFVKKWISVFRLPSLYFCYYDQKYGDGLLTSENFLLHISSAGLTVDGFRGIIKLGKRDDMPHKEEPHGKLEKFPWGSSCL